MAHSAMRATRSFRRLRSSLARPATVSVAPSGDLRLTWSDGEARSFHPLWLRDNCPATRHGSSRQKLVSAATLPPGLRPAEAAVSADSDELSVLWDPDGHRSVYSASWLRSLAAPDAEAAGCDAAEAEAYGSAPTLARLAFGELTGGGDEAPLWRLASLLQERGVVLVHGAPAEPGAVTRLARRIGPVQPQIYGEAWDVVTSERAINLAYTGEPLGPHMDLCYYESPPGLQLLHCLRFDESIAGGESTLIDAFAVARALRRSQPRAFADLARIPATSLKDPSMTQSWLMSSC